MDIDLMSIVGTLIVGVGIPLLVQILKPIWKGVPSALKTIAPIIIVPLLGFAGAWLTKWVGIPVDFGPGIADESNYRTSRSRGSYILLRERGGSATSTAARRVRRRMGAQRRWRLRSHPRPSASAASTGLPAE